MMMGTICRINISPVVCVDYIITSTRMHAETDECGHLLRFLERRLTEKEEEGESMLGECFFTYINNSALKCDLKFT